MRLLAILFAFALIAAACGDDDDESGGEEGTEETETGNEEESSLGGEEEAPPAEEEAPDEGEEAPPAEEETPDEGGEEEMAGGLADPAIHGEGSVEYETAALAAEAGNGTPADESLEPVLFTMANLEGDALGSFPEIREGLEIAIDQINNDFGGINGRPIELDVCVHGFDPNAAINCANEIAEAQPNLNINGIEFFTPALYPTFLGANVPTVQTVPIFVADFVQPEVISVYGGCPVAFPGGATYTMETLGLQKVVVLYSNTPPGLECYADTQERFWQYLVDNEAAGAEFIGLADNSGDPSDNDAIVQQMADFFGDSPAEETGVYFGIQASDCNEILSAIDAAGLDTTVVASGSCIDDSVLANPAATGALFGQQGYISERPDLYDDYIAWTLNYREDLLDNSDLRTAPVSAFLRVGYGIGITAWEVLTRMDNNGEDIDDPAAMVAAWQGLENQHQVGSPPVTCTDNTEEYAAICKKTLTYTVWNGTEWELGDLDGEYLSVRDIQARVAAGNPRPAAEE